MFPIFVQLGIYMLSASANYVARQYDVVSANHIPAFYFIMLQCKLMPVYGNIYLVAVLHFRIRFAFD